MTLPWHADRDPDPSDAHEIVLDSVMRGSEGAVAAALNRILSIPDDFALDLVESAPVIILSGLGRSQARRVMGAMVSVERAGGRLVEAPAGTRGPETATLNWPGPPTISGRGLETFR